MISALGKAVSDFKQQGHVVKLHLLQLLEGNLGFLSSVQGQAHQGQVCPDLGVLAVDMIGLHQRDLAVRVLARAEEGDARAQPGARGRVRLAKLEEHLLGCHVVLEVKVAVAYVQVQIQEEEAGLDKDGAFGKSVVSQKQVANTEGELEQRREKDVWECYAPR